MHFHLYIFALVILRSLSVLTQQTCYWPDGSGVRPYQAYWVNCYSTQASTCCLNGDVCLSNGLCYGPGIGMTYRGGCTLKGWDNTTACPNQWCNDVQTDSWSNLWKCPPVNNGLQWWCGNETETTACQGGIHASFPSYTSGHVLGFPPLTPSSSTPTRGSSNLMNTASSTSAGLSSKPISAPASSTVITAAQTQKQSTIAPTETSTPGQNQNHSTSLPTAIGVGIGVPLGLAVISLFGFLFWRETMRQRKLEPQVPSQRPVHGKEDQSAATFTDGQWPELPDAQLPREMDGRGKAELSDI